MTVAEDLVTGFENLINTANITPRPVVVDNIPEPTAQARGRPWICVGNIGNIAEWSTLSTNTNIWKFDWDLQVMLGSGVTTNIKQSRTTVHSIWEQILVALANNNTLGVSIVTASFPTNVEMEGYGIDGNRETRLTGNINIKTYGLGG